MMYLTLLALMGVLDICSAQCRTATDWGRSFDMKGWSNFGNTKYVTGFYRNTNRGNNMYLLEHAKCCKAPTRPQSCTTANWWRVLDRYLKEVMKRTAAIASNYPTIPVNLK